MSGWFEDVEIGARRDIGTHTFTQDEIIAFAKKYDPQVFHIDPEGAKHSMFGGIIAIGLAHRCHLDATDDRCARKGARRCA